MSRLAQLSVTMRLTLFGLLSVVLILGSAVACSSSSKSAGGGSTSSSGTGAATSAGSSATDPNTVVIKNFSFAPMSLTVAVGTKVTWKFEDSAQHTVVADDKSFSSPAMSNGQTFSFTFSKAGTFQYICSIHQYMKGTIVVQ